MGQTLLEIWKKCPALSEVEIPKFPGQKEEEKFTVAEERGHLE